MLDACIAILRQHAGTIARGVAEQTNLDTIRGPVEAIVARLPSTVERGDALDTSHLQEAGIDDETITRVLRAIEGQVIDLLRSQQPASAIRDCVLRLRDCIRHSIVTPARDDSIFEFFRRLIEEPHDDGPDEQKRLRGFFRAVMSGLNDMVYVHDINGNLLFVNKRGRTMTGFTKSDLLAGMTIHDFVTPAYVDIVRERLDTSAAAGWSPFTIEIFSKEGDRIPLEVTTRPLMEGKVSTGVIGIARDLRFERRVETQLRRVQHIQEQILNHAPVGIIVADKSGLISDINDAAADMLGAPDRCALLGKPLSDLVATQDTVARERIRLAFAGESQTTSEYQTVSIFGKKIHCQVALIPFHDMGGIEGGIVGLLNNMSDTNILQQGLIQNDKLRALGEIIAGVSHELNNPLTGIVGYTQLVLAGDIPADIRTRVNHIAMEASRCQRIVQNLLSFSRQQEAHMALGNVNAVVDKTLELREYQLRVDGIEIHVEKDANLPNTLIDANALQSVFLNLLNNAQQAMIDADSPTKRLEIRTEQRGNTLRIVFRDSGPGVLEEARNRVFDPFFTTKELGKGTGLGLSVSYGIVQNHGGYIRLESPPEGGAIFTVVLPITETRAPEA